MSPSSTTPAGNSSVGIADFVRSVLYGDNLRSNAEHQEVIGLIAEGHNDCAVARMTGIPRTTVRDWRHTARDGSEARPRRDTTCHGHDDIALDTNAYAYLLGLYLGDGCISKHARTWRLRITLDRRYSSIVAECAAAMSAVTPGTVKVAPHHTTRAVVVSNYWKHLPCVFPQHGPGRKHHRPIYLAPWQQEIVSARPEPLLRGLIHSDGCRIIATERKRNNVRRAPRYCFSNHSEDIFEIFQTTCEAIGVHTTRAI